MPASTPASMPGSTPADDNTVTATAPTISASTITASSVAGATLPAPAVDLSGDLSGVDQMVVIRHRPDPQTVLVQVFGEVDLCTAPHLRRVLDDARGLVTPTDPTDPADPAQDGARGRGQVVCDLSKVEFLGAAALAVLAEADHAARAHRTRLRVVTGTGRVRRVLALSGTDRDLDTSWQLGDLGDPGDVQDAGAAGPGPDAA